MSHMTGGTVSVYHRFVADLAAGYQPVDIRMAAQANPSGPVTHDTTVVCGMGSVTADTLTLSHRLVGFDVFSRGDNVLVA